MRKDNNILELVQKRDIQASHEARRCLIIQPGALGDSILTLPLAEFVRNSLKLGRIDLLGHSDYISMLVGRSCIDRIRSIESVELQRLFTDAKTFEISDRDSLINFFADYSWILTFLGEPESNFEHNLIFTANCSQSTEVITLSLKPSTDYHGHISDYYIRQFVEKSQMPLKYRKYSIKKRSIKATSADVTTGKKILKEAGLDNSGRLAVIHPGSGAVNKCWHLDNFLSLAEAICLKGLQTLFLLGPCELERFKKTEIKKIESISKFVTNLSLTEILALLSCVDFFIGNDSGVTHLSAGTGVNTISVFGPTNPILYRPLGPHVTIFEDRRGDFSENASPAMVRKLFTLLQNQLKLQI